MKKIEITIPVLNEEETLKTQVEKVLVYLRSLNISQNYDLKVIISDNGSTDGTKSIGLALEEQYPNEVIYLEVGRRGVGLALKTSWLKSQADFVGYMDLDLATDINHLAEVFKFIDENESDVIYGSRLAAGSKVVGRSLKREITSRVFNWLLKTYLSVSFSDGMCGFKFLRRSVVSDLIAGGANSDGWFYCTEILVVSEWKGLKLSELPVHWNDDPNSKVKIANLSFEYIKAMKSLKALR